MIILRLTPSPKPPLKKSPPIDSLMTSLLVGFLPPVQKSLQITLRRMSKSHLKSHQNHWTLSLCLLRMNWEIPHLLQWSLALRFPRAWVRTRSINSALPPLNLRPFCFRYIFSSLVVIACTSFTCFIYHTLSCIAIKISTVGFFILLNCDAMCANIGIFLFHSESHYSFTFATFN